MTALLACLFLCAGPVPAPEPLTADSLVGVWDVTEGDWAGGMAFHPDGTYSWWGGSCGAAGVWWVTERGELRLRELHETDSGPSTTDWVYAGLGGADARRGRATGRGWRVYADSTGEPVPVTLRRAARDP